MRNLHLLKKFSQCKSNANGNCVRIHTFWFVLKIHLYFKYRQFLATVHVINSFKSLGPSSVSRHRASANYNNAEQTHILFTSTASDHFPWQMYHKKVLTDTRSLLNEKPPVAFKALLFFSPWGYQFIEIAILKACVIFLYWVYCSLKLWASRVRSELSEHRFSAPLQNQQGKKQIWIQRSPLHIK